MSTFSARRTYFRPAHWRMRPTSARTAPQSQRLRPRATMGKAPKIDPQDAGPHPVGSAAAYAALRRGNHRHQIRRPRHGPGGERARFRPRRRAARTGRHQSGRGAWRRPADRGHAQEARHQIRIRRGPAHHRRQATVEIVEMVLAGSINKQIVGYINAAGGKAIGLCGKDGNMVQARKVSAHRGRSRFQYREGRRSRFRRRARQGRSHRAQRRARQGDDPGAGAGRDLGRPAAPSTSMPTPSPAPSPARSRPSACCCSPTCRACSTSRRP